VAGRQGAAGKVAHFYPNGLRAGAPASERRVFEGLKKLGDDWVVIQGLQFVAPAHGRHPPRNGEADFILAHRNQGLIVLEVKGGHYEVEHDRWFTFPDSKRTPMNRSPFAQAMQNRYNLRDYVVDRTGSMASLSGTRWCSPTRRGAGPPP
jgi:nuclease-like protein